MLQLKFNLMPNGFVNFLQHTGKTNTMKKTNN